MDTKPHPHPHAAALDRLGFDPLTAYFGITRQTFRNWRRNGIPKRDWQTVKLIASSMGVETPEVKL